MSATPEPCDHCGELIMWLIHAETGNRAPITAKPHELGNIVRQGSTYGVLPLAKARAARAAGTPLRVHHAVTCPYADQWRNKPTKPSRRRKARR